MPGTEAVATGSEERDAGIGVDSPERTWRSGTRAVFRFVFCYFVFNLLDCGSIAIILLSHIFGSHPTELVVDKVWKHVVPWVAANLLRIHKPGIASGGGSDSTYAVVLILCELVLALVATVVWTLRDGRRLQYRRLHQWLRLAVQLVAGVLIVSYGAAKVFPYQFGSLTPSRLMARFGDLSPFELLWGFMAASKGYTILCGLVEVLGGTLLLIPRWTTVGALLSSGALGNVLALNMFYGVPVKFLALHLLLMCLFLLAPDLPRIADLLVFQRAVVPAGFTPLSERRSVHRGALILYGILGASFCLLFLWGSSRGYSRQRAALASHPPLYGTWVVEDFVASTDPKRSLFTERIALDLGLQPGENRWQRLFFEKAKELTIECQNGAMEEVTLEWDAATTVAQLSDWDPEWKTSLTFEKTGADSLNMRGTVNGVEVSARLRQMAETSKFRLTSSKFSLLSD